MNHMIPPLEHLWKLFRACMLTCILMTEGGLVQAGTHYWSGAGANNLWSNPDNWDVGGRPFSGEINCFLIFPSASGYVSVQDIPNLLIARMTLQHDSYIFTTSGGAKFTFRGGVSLSSAGYFTTFNSSASIELQGTNEWSISAPGYLGINGPITGTGNLVKEGDGTLALGGAAANTASGFTQVNEGELRLAKSAGITAIAGPLIISTNAVYNASQTAKVVSFANHQIADTSPITLRATGLLDLNGSQESIGALTILGGTIKTGSGTLTFLEDILCDGPAINGSNTGSDLYGNLSLGAQTRTFTTTAFGSLSVFGNITGAAGAGITKKGAGGMGLFGTNSYSGLTMVSEGSLGAGTVAGNSKTPLGTTAGGTVVASGARLSIAALDVGLESLQLNGDPEGRTPVVLTVIGDCSWAGPVSLAAAATNTIRVLNIPAQTGATMNFSGVISGPGHLRFQGELQNGADCGLTLSGNAANSYSGSTLIDTGTLRLNKSSGINAIAGPLLIGTNGYTSVKNTKVISLASHQISDAASVSLRTPGALNLNGFNESVGTLEMLGGAVETGTGTLTLLSDIQCDGPEHEIPVPSIFEGKLSLGSKSRLFTIHPRATLWIGAELSGAAGVGFTKTGEGSMDLWGPNTYSGLTVVEKGSLSAGHAFYFNETPLGSTAAGTLVKAGGFLNINSVDIGDESLTLQSDPSVNGAQLNSYGFCTWTGPISVSSAVAIYNRGGTLSLSGPISGSGSIRFLVASEAGSSITLSGPSPNTYLGKTELIGGPLLLNKPDGVISIPGELELMQVLGSSTSMMLLHSEQIGDKAAVFLDAGSSLNLNNLPETIGSLAGGGLVNTLFSTLTVGGNNLDTTFTGSIGGSGAVTLVKQGSGVLILPTAQTYLGRTRVIDGTLLVHGSLLSPTSVSNGAVLGGSGVMTTLASTNAIVSPGGSPGRLSTKDFALNSSTLKIELNGPNPGTGYDQLHVDGSVALITSKLQVSAGFSSKVGDQFLIVENDGAELIVGRFIGLPQDAVLNTEAGSFQISYTAGTGNDIVLTRINTAPGITDLSVTPFVEEGGTVSVNGTIQDPDLGDTFTLTIKWGDGSPAEIIPIVAGSKTLHAEHVYTDDKPGAAASDNYTIEYVLTDSAGSPALGNLNVVVGNVPPSIPKPSAEGVKAGATLTKTITFVDPGTDAWSATVNYGDGSGVQSLPVGAGHTVALNHVFPTNGVYGVTVSVKDDDNEVGTTGFDVVVGLELSILPRNATHALVRWPALFTGFTLQRSESSITESSWQSVPEAPALIGEYWQVTVPHNNGAGFFRLLQP